MWQKSNDGKGFRCYGCIGWYNYKKRERVCRFADQEDEILANLHQVDGETLVIPIDQEERFNLTSTQRNLSTWTAKRLGIL